MDRPAGALAGSAQGFSARLAGQMIARLVSFAAAHAPSRWSGASAGDWRAGWVSAVVILPQTVVLATLAGMPPETGVYTSVFPVIVAALLGSSPRLLSGPNTAVAVMLAAALTPLATPYGRICCARPHAHRDGGAGATAR